MGFVRLSCLPADSQVRPLCARPLVLCSAVTSSTAERHIPVTQEANTSMSKRHRFLNKVIGRQSITAEDALENNTLAGDGTVSVSSCETSEYRHAKLHVKAETPLGTVRIRILAARGLEGKDRNGKSDRMSQFFANKAKRDSYRNTVMQPSFALEQPIPVSGLTVTS